MPFLELISVACGIVYVLLAARENSWCWPAAFVGTGTAIALFWDASLIMESALNVYYLLMAVFGWWQWQYGRQSSNEQSPLRIHSWGAQQHAITFGAIAILTFGSGHVLALLTGAAMPYLDSFTTWSAVITTWMVTRKVLENWLYWIVINAASIYLYFDRELYLYALLAAAYTVISVFGYVNWRAKLATLEHRQTHAA